MLVRFKDLIDAGTLSVRVVDGRMVLALPTDVLFDSGSARLSKTGKEAAQQVGSVLAAMSRRRVQVEGHTDNMPIHNAQFASNWELASARALVVVRAMMQSGIPSDAVSAASYGEFHPARATTTRGPRRQPPHRDRAVARPLQSAWLRRAAAGRLAAVGQPSERGRCDSCRRPSQLDGEDDLTAQTHVCVEGP